MQIKPADLMSAGGTLMIIEPLTQCQQGVYPCFQDFLNNCFKYQIIITLAVLFICIKPNIPASLVYLFPSKLSSFY